MEVKSPITGDHKVKFIKKIKVEDIVSKYKNRLDMDVSPYFGSLEDIFVYEDLTTQYRFYYPFDIDGDSAFYEQLQGFPWYYMPWKWEHEKCTQLITTDMKLLEIGCASGDFLKRIVDEKKIKAVGLELNEKALRMGQEKGLDVRGQSVEEHAVEFPEYYDMICSFQVLEHISDVQHFLLANIKCLKKGGKLVFCVPNNDGFAKYNWENDILNMPPHHMGLWTRTAFEGLEKIFDLHLSEVYYEPLQSYHTDWYLNIQERRFLKLSLLRRVYEKTGGKNIMKALVNKFRPHLHGHTIMAVFTK